MKAHSHILVKMLKVTQIVTCTLIQKKEETKGVSNPAHLITFFKIGKPPRVSDEIDGLTGIASEHHITIARRIDKVCHLFP